jgi:hypothetical protein
MVEVVIATSLLEDIALADVIEPEEAADREEAGDEACELLCVDVTAVEGGVEGSTVLIDRLVDPDSVKVGERARLEDVAVTGEEEGMISMLEDPGITGTLEDLVTGEMGDQGSKRRQSGPVMSVSLDYLQNISNVKTKCC